MPELRQSLAGLLAEVQRPGGFHVAGVFDIHPPRLSVKGVGPVSLPLLPVQAEALIQAADQAPYGKGTETLVDTQVRRTWQIDARQVTLAGARWTEDLAGVVERVRTGLAVSGDIEAQLYKLLVYDEGSFFVPHRDTEKAPGMFATLVVVLPGDYTGGELVIRHGGEEATVDLRRDEPSEAAFAAFYADCVHEVRPIASGYRLALIYNLVRQGDGPLPQAPDYERERTRAAALLADWAAKGDAPDKLVYPLEHAYSEAELAFAALKGRDAAVAQVLLPAAASAGCDLHLALMTVYETGWAEYTGGGRWEDPALEIGEVTDEAWSIRDWRLPDGTRPAMGPLPFDAEELAPPEALAEIEETEPEFSEATGNEGASFERQYQRAALVLWPVARRAQVLAEGGVEVSVPALAALVERWQAAGDEDLHREACALARAIQDAWPEQPWQRRRASQAGHAGTLLDAQLALGDLDGCVAFVTGIAAAGAYSAEDNGALARVLTRLDPDLARSLLGAVIEGNAARAPGACAGLLALITSTDPARSGALQGPARALLDRLPGGPQAASLSPQDRPEPLTPAQVADALTAFARIDPALADALLDRVLSLSGVYDADRLLLPAALLVKTAGGDRDAPTASRLREAMLAHLDARIALPLAPPADWTRPSDVPCGCQHCRALSVFLAAPAEPVWRLKAAEAQRRHVTDTIKRGRCDLDLSTEKKGSPHILVCRKNQASYLRRVEERKLDLECRRRLLA